MIKTNVLLTTALEFMRGKHDDVCSKHIDENDVVPLMQHLENHGYPQIAITGKLHEFDAPSIAMGIAIGIYLRDNGYND